jgi:hypothetical protein
MNIFYLHPEPKTCAEMHNDKHCVKMIIEYAQLMSTAHRLLDGVPYTDKTANGRSIKRWRLQGPDDSVMMKASHINHPSAVWTRSNRQNYVWLYHLWYHLCKEYTYRYGKVHAVETRLRNALYLPPANLISSEFYPPTPAMPDTYKVMGDSIASYRNYYNGGKQHLATWKKRPMPDWFRVSNV